MHDQRPYTSTGTSSLKDQTVDFIAIQKPFSNCALNHTGSHACYFQVLTALIGHSVQSLIYSDVSKKHHL